MKNEKVTFPLRKVTFIFIDRKISLLTSDFQIFFVPLPQNIELTNIIEYEDKVTSNHYEPRPAVCGGRAECMSCG